MRQPGDARLGQAVGQRQEVGHGAAAGYRRPLRRGRDESRDSRWRRADYRWERAHGAPPDRPRTSSSAATAIEQIVVLAFPYDATIVNVVRGIPGRRFDWDRREWWAPIDDWVGVHVVGVLDRFPDLVASDEVVAWIAAIDSRWVGFVGATRYDGRGWWTLSTRAGEPPAELLDGLADPRRTARCWRR